MRPLLRESSTRETYKTGIDSSALTRQQEASLGELVRSPPFVELERAKVNRLNVCVNRHAGERLVAVRQDVETKRLRTRSGATQESDNT